MRPIGNQESTISSSSHALPAWIHDLEELRTSVISRLRAIEDLAGRRSSATSLETAPLVQSLREKIEELERDRHRLQADAEREASDWKRLQAQLENDRQLLAEAWERLEHERIESKEKPTASSPRHSAAIHRQRAPEDGAAQVVSPLRTAPSAETGNPVAETILRQFQVLCGDVRRTTNARCSSG